MIRYLAASSDGPAFSKATAAFTHHPAFALCVAFNFSPGAHPQFDCPLAISNAERIPRGHCRFLQDAVVDISVDNADVITLRYGEITSAFNRTFRDTDSKEANSLQVGSYGRWTAIKGISDLDMLYIMPTRSWDTYNVDGGQSKLLADTCKSIKARCRLFNVQSGRGSYASL